MLSIAFFGLAGVFSRYWAGIWVSQVLPIPFPFATMMINLTGSFLIGVAYVMGAEKALFTEPVFVGIVVGFLGGFTTFSSFSLEGLRLFEEGRYVSFLSYTLGSLVFGLLSAAAGLLIARKLL